MARDRRKREYPAEKKKTPARIIIGWFTGICVVVVIICALSSLTGVAVKAQSGAMSPSIEIGETVAVNHIAYLLLPPRRGDIIQFKISKSGYESSSDNNSTYIRRIVGLPGETVQISDGVVYINGVPLSEKYRSGEMVYSGTASTALTLNNDEYFVLADNRSNNVDSRDSTIGPVDGHEIVGKVWLKIAPVKEFGLL